jgi:type IV secretory pathway VirB6-like protein
MNLVKKITQIFSLVFLIAFSSSCKEQCFTTDEFNVSNVVVDAYPTVDGIDGATYDATTGGQTARWHDTTFKSNGDAFLIKISGAWTPWGGGIYHDMNDTELNALSVCKTCAKRDPSTKNCICYAGTNSTAELYQTCSPTTMQLDGNGVSTGVMQQDNPGLCSCTKNPIYGTASDYGVYHFPLNYYDKSETMLIADKQSTCKFIAGMGAYIGLFGRSGVTDPARLYHLFVEDYDALGKATKVCDITLNSNGECKDSSGKDRTAYVFKSANERIFMKDDGDGNTGVNTNTANDTYHGPNEVVKVKIFDLYYNDNYGKYNIDILKGVGDNSDLSTVGLLEFMVRLVENALLGDLEPVTALSQDASGNTITTTTYERVGGIIEFMFRSIVQDSGFRLILQVTLSLYVAFYGLSVLLGIVEVSRKELMNRLLKISLIMFFTGANSWYFYNEFIVGFFYDSMNYIVSMMMSLSDNALSQGMDTSAIMVAQMDRAIDVSSSTRFSYIDSTIEMMLSPAFAGKVFSLVLADLFGIFYVVGIYALVGYFIYTMMIAASMYLMNMMKIIFVLCLGPIFISFTLFNQTNTMFKNWLAFLGARALEIILIFAILYNFVMLIDASFRDLLSYTACVEPFSFGLFSINILKASGIGDRTIVTWLTSMTKIAALIFITQLILNKVAEVAGHLITIGGVANKNADGVGHGQSGMTLAGAGGADNKDIGKSGIMGSLLSAGTSAVGTAMNIGATAAMYGGKGLAAASRALGIDEKLSKLGDYNVPMKAMRSMGRNSIIDPIIKQAQKDSFDAKNKDGSALTAPQRDAFVRNQTFAKLNAMAQQKDPNGAKDAVNKPLMSAALGLSHDHIAARLDQKQIHEPAKALIKAKEKELKAQGMYGSELKGKLKEAVNDWAGKNLSSGAAELKASLDKKGKDGLTASEKDLKNALKSASLADPAQVGRLVANKPEEQKKFMQYLQDKEAKRHMKNAEADKNKFKSASGFANWASNLASRGLDGAARVAGFESAARNPLTAQETFMRNLQNAERSDGSWTNAGKNALNKSNTISKMFGSGSMNRSTTEAQQANLRGFLAQDHQKPKEVAPLKPHAPLKDKKAHALATAKANSKDDNRRTFFQGRLQELATKDLLKKVGDINKLERKGKFSEANAAKREMLTAAQEALRMDPNNKKAFQQDGRSLFEKAARLSYLQKQFGIKDEDPMKTLSKALNDGIKKESGDILKEAQEKRPAAVKEKAEDLKLLKSGLFTDANNEKAFEKMAAILNPAIDSMIKKGADGLEDKISRDNQNDYTNPLKSLKEELKDPILGGPTPEDKKALAEENAELNQDKKDGKTELDKLDKELGELDGKFQKEDKIREEAERERVEAEAREKVFKEAVSEPLRIMIDFQMEIMDIERQLKSPELTKEKREEFELALKVDKEGLAKAKEDTLKLCHTYEEENRIRSLEKLNKEVNKLLDGPDKTSPAALEEAKVLSDKISTLRAEIAEPSVAKSVKELSGEITAGIEKAKTSGGVIAGLEGADVAMHGNITDALLKGGIEGSFLSGNIANSLLGAHDAPKDGIDPAKAKELGMKKNQVSGQLKLNKMDLKVAQFKLNALDPNSPEYKSEKAKLEAEISKLESDGIHLEREEHEIESELKPSS